MRKYTRNGDYGIQEFIIYLMNKKKDKKSFLNYIYHQVLFQCPTELMHSMFSHALAFWAYLTNCPIMKLTDTHFF